MAEHLLGGARASLVVECSAALRRGASRRTRPSACADRRHVDRRRRLKIWDNGTRVDGASRIRSITRAVVGIAHAAGISIPQNLLLAEALFLSGYIEKSGTGTTEMIRQCKAVGLPEPTFEQRGDQWTVTLWRDWLTDAFIAGASLNARQISALAAVKAKGAIDNTAYQDLTGASKRTATRDLGELVDKGILVRTGGDMGRGAGYQKAKARPEPSSAAPKAAAAKKGQKGAKGAKAAPKTKGQKGAKATKTAKKRK